MLLLRHLHHLNLFWSHYAGAELGRIIRLLLLIHHWLLWHASHHVGLLLLGRHHSRLCVGGELLIRKERILLSAHVHWLLARHAGEELVLLLERDVCVELIHLGWSSHRRRHPTHAGLEGHEVVCTTQSLLDTHGRDSSLLRGSILYHRTFLVLSSKHTRKIIRIIIHVF